MHRADAEGNFLRINDLSAALQGDHRAIKIGIIRLPQVAGSGITKDNFDLSDAPAAIFTTGANWSENSGLPSRSRICTPTSTCFIRAPAVLDRHLHVHRRRFFGNVRRINVRPFGLQKIVERQRNVQRVNDKQFYVAVNAAHRRMPLRVVPGNLVGLELVHVRRNGGVLSWPAAPANFQSSCRRRPICATCASPAARVPPEAEHCPSHSLNLRLSAALLRPRRSCRCSSN